MLIKDYWFYGRYYEVFLKKMYIITKSTANAN